MHNLPPALLIDESKIIEGRIDALKPALLYGAPYKIDILEELRRLYRIEYEYALTMQERRAGRDKHARRYAHAA
jgi:hypothetical protein